MASDALRSYFMRQPHWRKTENSAIVGAREGALMSDRSKRQILAVNAAFYAALRAGDMAAMEALWSRRDAVSAHHPNSQGIEGRDQVMRSWRQIVAFGDPPDIHPVEPLAILSGATAMVICEEKLGAARTIATNVFVLEQGVWRLVHHQATRLPPAAGGRAGAKRREPRRQPGRGDRRL